MQKKGEIESFVENHTTSTVSFTVNMKSVQLSRMKKTGLEKVFKLDSNLSLNNMHAFDDMNTIRRYSTPEEVVETYFPIRMRLYHDRKDVLQCSKEYEASLLRNKAKFIKEVVDGKIDLIKGGSTKKDTVHQLLENDFSQISDLQMILSGGDNHPTIDATVKSLTEEEKMKQFDYLLNMPLASLTAEKVDSLLTEADKTESELKEIQDASPEILWNNDLDKLELFLKKGKKTKQS